VSTQLWRVFTYTEGDESVSERIVAAPTAKEAKLLAVMNVKAQNLGKGHNTEAEARANTRILAAKKCGKDGVLTINRFPVAVVRDWGKKV
jgi:hypothetical protein